MISNLTNRKQKYRFNLLYNPGLPVKKVNSEEPEVSQVFDNISLSYYEYAANDIINSGS